MHKVATPSMKILHPVVLEEQAMSNNSFHNAHVRRSDGRTFLCNACVYLKQSYGYCGGSSEAEFGTEGFGGGKQHAPGITNCEHVLWHAFTFASTDTNFPRHGENELRTDYS